MHKIIIGFTILAVAIVYFTPSIIAVMSHRKNTGAVIIINVFLGWTLIGWVIAFAMAVSGDKET